SVNEMRSAHRSPGASPASFSRAATGSIGSSASSTSTVSQRSKPKPSTASSSSWDGGRTSPTQATTHSEPASGSPTGGDPASVATKRLPTSRPISDGTTKRCGLPGSDGGNQLADKVAGDSSAGSDSPATCDGPKRRSAPS